MNQATDIIVKTGNPAALDRILQSFGAVVIQTDLNKATYMEKDGGYVVRCLNNTDFVKFIIKNQGYGEVIKTLDELVYAEPTGEVTKQRRRVYSPSGNPP